MANPTPSARVERPNIILITTDQQRYDTCGPRAPSFLRTPHFNQLCHQGIRFDKAFADCPLCVPARVAIMTGRHVTSHGMTGNLASKDYMGDTDTLPAQLHRLGYQTCGIGKFHFTPQRKRHGFDEMIIPEDYYLAMQRSGSPLQPMRHGLGQNELFPTLSTVPESMTLTNWIAQQCVDYLHERRDPTVPFFLWCSFSKPHPPLDPPEPYYSMYRDAPIPDPVYGDWSENERCPAIFRRQRETRLTDLLNKDVIRAGRAAYYGLITQIDYTMGRIFGALRELKLYHDSLILYTSDHGELLGDHHAGNKSFFYEGSAHIPFAMRIPSSWENRRHGTVSNALVTHADILPTVVKAAGGTPPPGTDGRDLVAVAQGRIAPRKYLEVTSNDYYHAITDGRWKYIFYPEGGVEQFFDLDKDPYDLVDLAGTPSVAAPMRRLKGEMIRRLAHRKSPLVRRNRLVAQPIKQLSEIDVRNNFVNIGLMTEQAKVDTRH